MKYTLSKAQASSLITARLSHFFGVTPQEASYDQFYKAIAMIVRDMMSDGRSEFAQKADQENVKHVYYLCMEFLMGRSLKNNLYNLGLTEVFSQALADYGIKLESLYDSEPDAGLGNGGLGRLAAWPPAIWTALPHRVTWLRAILSCMNTGFSSRKL